MKKTLILLSIVMLAGCSTVVPVKQKFPEVPQELLKPCPDLKEVDPTTHLSDVLRVVTENYSQYHECRITTDTWIEWYNTQKSIFNK